MRFIETPLRDLVIVELDTLNDERGFFARSFCEREFRNVGIELSVAQCNISFNEKAGTLRGLHFQASPHEEAKLIRCTRGAIHDVVVDVRRGSPTYLRWHAVTLTPSNGRMLFVPRGFAHGFQSLEDHSEVFYMMSEFYHPGSARGLRWNDPALAIVWPLENPIISENDRHHPLLESVQP